MPWTEATSTVTFAFIDDAFLSREGWRAWTRARSAEVTATRILVPVSLSPRFDNLHLPMQAIRLHELPPDQLAAEASTRLHHVVWRALRGRPAGRLFISHAKSDGREVALALRRYIQDTTTIQSLFDEVSLLEGDHFEPQLDAQIRAACAFLVVLTDAWSDRFWCQRELLCAKEAGVPVVVVDALQNQVPRQFPYLGNGLALRWAPGHEATIVGRVMLEAARDAFVDTHLDRLARAGWLPAKAGTLDRPPELATLARWRNHRCLVHPDPPLALHELDLLGQAAPRVRICTPTQSLMRRNPDDSPLAGHRIALSISDPPHEELTRLGSSNLHTRRAWIALTRHLLAAGACIDYGGDQRTHGYSEQLIELVRAHRQAALQMNEVAVRMHAAWPQLLKLTEEQLADLPEPIKLVPYPKPADLTEDAATWIAPDTAENRYACGRALTDMRVAMAEGTVARVVLGGQWKAVSRISGMAEEALLHLEAGKPVYLLGGFGGMTAAIAAAVRGEHPAALTPAFQLSEPLPQASAALYNARIPLMPSSVPPTARMPVNYDDLRARFAAFGVRGLDNGLNDEENRRLMTTRDLTEAIGLVLYGLQRRLGTSMKKSSHRGRVGPRS